MNALFISASNALRGKMETLWRQYTSNTIVYNVLILKYHLLKTISEEPILSKNWL